MNSAVFQNTLNKEISIDKTTTRVIGCLAFALFTAIGAYVRIPLFFTPVPLTLQTFFVILSGAALGRKWGALSQVLYVSLGASGLPVFQGYGRGMTHILGPTGGYLLGFICAAYIVGYFVESDILEKSRLGVFTAMITGLVVVYLCGVAWLKLLLGANLKASLLMGLYPFLPGEIVKVIAASYVYFAYIAPSKRA